MVSDNFLIMTSIWTIKAYIMCLHSNLSQSADWFNLIYIFLGVVLYINCASILRFNYIHYDKSHGAIYKSIEVLDKMGMDIIETGDPDAFKLYLSETDNTICGRHPISVFLHVTLLFSFWQIVFSWKLFPFLLSMWLCTKPMPS